jgi:hypothetical protein
MDLISYNLKTYNNEKSSTIERFASCMTIAKYYAEEENDFDKAFPWLMKSYSEFERVEGLIQVVKYYMRIDRYLLAYSLALVCLFTQKFDDIGCDDFIYDFERHYLLAKICVKLNKKEEGTHHIKKAVEGLKEEYGGKKFEMYEEYLNSCKELFLVTGA